MFIITDTTTGTQTTVEYAEEIAASIAPWHPEAPAEVLGAIDEFQEVLLTQRHPETSALEALLSITWDVAP